LKHSIYFFPLLLILAVGLYAWGGSIPSNTPHELSVPLYYPPTLTPSYDYSSLTGGNDIGPFILLVNLTWNGLLAENVPVRIVVSGVLTPSFANNVSSVFLSFEGVRGIPRITSVTSLIAPLTGLILNRTVPLATGWSVIMEEKGTFQWEIQGDYSPIIVVNYKNFATPDYAVYSYYKLHISSEDVVQQEKNGNIATVLTIAFFVLAFMESVYLIVDHYPRKKKPEENKDIQQLNATIAKLIDKIDKINQSEKTEVKDVESPKRKPSWFRFRHPKNK